jgi:Divergent InlB B-repeat domain
VTQRARVSVTIGLLGALLILSLLVPPGGLGVGAATAANGRPTPLVGPAGLSGGGLGISHSGSAHAVPAAGPVASGRGTFFQTSDAGSVPSTHRSCFAATCVNVTNDPSLNLTTRGVLAVAYTAYTNDSSCASMAAYAHSEVGFRSSTNGGTTWSTAQFLGNPDCSSGTGKDYPSAWEPSLTSLGNGTLVLAYVEYNVSAAGFTSLPYVQFGPVTWNVNYDRLVLRESYDNGSHWTTPTVLNSSANLALNNGAYAPQRPWASATGQTVYVAWMNWSENFGTVFNYTTYTYVPVGFASASVHLVASTNGGSSFAAPVTLVSKATAWGNYAMNPSVLIQPSGELLIVYVTNLTFHPLFDCGNGCFTAVWTVDIVLASSTTNGSSFTYVDAEPNMPVPVLSNGPFTDPSPQLAYSAATGQLFLAFTSMRFHPWCTPQYGCLSYEDPAVVFVTNSSTNGASWSALTVPAIADLAELITTSSVFLLPAIGVNATGGLDLAMTFVDGSQCQPNAPYACRQYEAFLTSADNGATFSPPVFVTGNSSVFPFIGSGTAFGTITPLGEYATMITAGSASWFGWTNAVCPPGLAPGSCNYPSALGGSGIEISQPFTGVGTTLTFHPTGLPGGASWQVNVLGNVRTGTSDLGFSGVPAGDNVSWYPIQNVSTGYGIRSAPTAVAPASPITVLANTTIAVTFSTQYLLNVEAIPPFTPPPGGVGNYCYGGPIIWDNPSCTTASMNITPVPGANWETPGTVVPLSVVNTTLYCGPAATCGSTDYANVTFLSWSGSGNGSYSGLSPNANVTMSGPINDTASFQVNGWCYYSYTPPTTPYCVLNTQSIVFQETGLPTGTNWSVTVSNANASNTNSSSTGILVATGPFTSGVASFSVWSIPAPAGKYWVPSTAPISPVVLPEGSVVQVTFTLESVSGGSFPVELLAQGLPSGTNWSYSLDGALGGVQGSAQTELLLTGGFHNVSAPTVVLENQTAYSLTLVQVQEFVLNQAPQNFTSFPARASIAGPAIVYLNFSLAFLLSIASSAGGNVTPASQWVVPGQSVTLDATADTGFYFVGWTGSGPGAVTSKLARITVNPGGAVREVATFARIPAPTWTVSVTSSGLPSSVVYSVTLGNHTYSGAGSFTIALLATGSYALAVPYAYMNGTDLTRFVPTAVTPSFTAAGDQVVIGTNGTIQVAFAAESVVSLTANVGGTVGWSATSPPALGSTAGGPGASWVESGTSVSWTASPATGFTFVGWSGTGAGSVNTTALTAPSTINGPVQESAAFAPIPPPAVSGFTLTLVPAGLASGALWNASVGTTGGSSVGGPIVVGGLNGSYTVSVPAIYTAPGVRYVNGSGSFTVMVHAALSVTVSFSQEVHLTVTGSAGGTVTPGSAWVPAGTILTLTATPNATSAFVGWNGTGAGAYTGSLTSTPVTLTGPIVEVATFAPVYAPVKTSTTTTSTNGIWISLGLLAALLVAGLVVGLIVGRRRPPSRSTDDATASDTEEAAPEGAPGSETTPSESYDAPSDVPTER